MSFTFRLAKKPDDDSEFHIPFLEPDFYLTKFTFVGPLPRFEQFTGCGLSNVTR
jgi:hypothetical protein